jgi:hypothetical protein
MGFSFPMPGLPEMWMRIRKTHWLFLILKTRPGFVDGKDLP